MVLFSAKYDIVGHSGDGCDIELVRADKVPKNNKERLKVIKVSTWTYTLTLPLKYTDKSIPVHIYIYSVYMCHIYIHIHTYTNAYICLYLCNTQLTFMLTFKFVIRLFFLVHFIAFFLQPIFPFENNDDVNRTSTWCLLGFESGVTNVVPADLPPPRGAW